MRSWCIRLGEQMFSIDERNKITLTIGDTATFNCSIEDLDGEMIEPQEGDKLTFSIDDTDFEIVAENNTVFVFTIGHEDTLGLEPGVYNYRVVLELNDAPYTIFQDEFIELLGGKDES